MTEPLNDEAFERRARQVGLLTYCVHTCDMTDKERMVLREILRAVETDTLSIWGATHMSLAPEVHVLFEKLKVQINA